MASYSKLDTVYRSLLSAKFFTKGWGKSENLKRLFAFRKTISNRETCQHLVSPDYPITIEKVENYPQYKILDGYFVSPFATYLPEVVPEESRIARFQMLLPQVWPAEPLRPVCLHLAGTGDHFYWRRRVLMARPLLKEAGIGSILLENPFYGSRKPKYQKRSSLLNVSDIFVMGGCLILESLALFHWCERQGFGPLGISGISMGGHMASLAGSSWHKPLPIIPCLSWSTASQVFTQGVMSSAIPWPVLQSQYSSDHVYQDEFSQMVHTPESDAFHAGVHFSRTYPSSMERMCKLAAEEKPDSSAQKVTNTYNMTKTSETLEKSESVTSSEEQQKLLMVQNSGLNVTVERAYSSSSDNAPKGTKSSKEETNRTKLEALDFMRGIMDEFTHLANFTVPVDPSLSIIVTATHDAYVPRAGIKSIADVWPGCEIRDIDCGHVAAFLFNQNVFRKAIIDAFEKTAQKYYQRSILNSTGKPISPPVQDPSEKRQCLSFS